MNDITHILANAQNGDLRAAEQLLPLVYEELRKLAAANLAREKPGNSLQPTALVHEAFVRLVGDGKGHDWNGRGHFFAAAATAMRRILVENARRKRRIKHGGGHVRADIEVLDISCELPDDDLLALDEALQEFKTEDPAKAELIELRFFAGLTNEEAAKTLGISSATAKRHWRYARAVLRSRIWPDETPEDDSQ